MQKKTFKIEEVLSAVKGYLLCDMGKVYEVLNFLTGDNLYTHQLPRAGRECAPHVFKQHPFLESIDLSIVNTYNWKQVVADIKSKHPNEIELQKIEGIAHVDPIEEAIQMKGKDNVIVVKPEDPCPLN